MYISKHMTASPITVSGLTSLPEARQILSQYQIRHLPVIDKFGKLVGILSDRDLRSAYPSSVASKEQAILAFDHVQRSTVADIMTTTCSTLSIDARLDDALHIFERDKVGAIPVLDDDGKVLGLFSLLDLTSAYGQLFGVEEGGTLYFVIKDEVEIISLASFLHCAMKITYYSEVLFGWRRKKTWEKFICGFIVSNRTRS